MTTAFVFPGQGAQQPGMLTALPEGAATTAVLAAAATELGDLARFDSPLESTTDIQLALLICGVAAARHLTDDRSTHVDAVAGHSVGAYAAAVTAGVLTFAEALDVVRIRGDEMTRACPRGEWGMAAVTGLSRRQVEDAVETLAVGDRLWIANINAADQLVLGGTRAALDGARDAVDRAGARRFELLDVPVASHGPVQRGTEAVLRERLSCFPHREQRVDYLADSTARRIRGNAGAVLEDLAWSVSCAVRWYDIARLMPELGVDRVIEMPPGNVLSKLIQSATSGVRIETLN